MSKEEFDISLETINIPSPLKRLLAAIIDFLVVGIIGLVIFTITLSLILSYIPRESLSFIVQYVVIFVIVFLVSLVWLCWIYFIIVTAVTKGGTVGKQALSLRIIKSYGARINFATAFGRELLKMALNFLPFLHLVIFFQKKHQGIHDLIARTLVIEYRWKNGRIMKIIGFLALPALIIGIYFVQEWTIKKTTTVLNEAKTEIFQARENETISGKSMQETPEEIFYANLYNGSHSPQEIDQLKKQFDAGIYSDESMIFLFTKDADLDGVSDDLEKKYQTNSQNKDTDADGITDQQEIKDGSSPIGLKNEPFTAPNTKTWQILNEQDFSFFIGYPVGWGFIKNDVNDYSFGILKENNELSDALVGMILEHQEGVDALPFYYFYPELYQAATLVRPFTSNELKGELLQFPLGIRIAILKHDQSVVQIIEILADEMEEGIFEGFIASLQPKK